MRIAVLHGANQGFFPRYYMAIKESVEQDGNSIVSLFVPDSKQNRTKVLPRQVMWGSPINWHVHNLMFRWSGHCECYSYFSTLDLIRKLKCFQPDVMHWNVINQCQLNVPMLVRYANKYSIPVVWTFHDCRAFTGGCPYFDEIGCNKWQSGCVECPLKSKGGNYIVGNTQWQWKFNKKWYTAIKNLTIVTPSRWLAGYVKDSFLFDKPCHVIYNGVDTDQFASRQTVDVRGEYALENSHVVLGCAVNWELRKGLDFFLTMAEMLPKEYRIVLVGGIGDDDKHLLESKGIIVTGRTNSFAQMAAWYQSADVFANPTVADNFPTVNIEALASGCPVVTFATGGSPEAIDETCGKIVPKGDLDSMVRAVIEVSSDRDRYSREACIERSKLFSNDNYKKYVNLYESQKMPHYFG